MIVNSSVISGGFTLPVWVSAAALAATKVLVGQKFLVDQEVDVPDQDQPLLIPVRSAALLVGGQQAIGITQAEPCNALDITRDLEIWTHVQWQENALEMDKSFQESEAWLNVVGGFGVGKNQISGSPCLSAFALELLHRNLRELVPKGRCLRLEIIFPAGKELAKRTSNEVFGVVEGLALIGTQSEVQLSASSEQLHQTLNELKVSCLDSTFTGFLTLVIGENGLDLARSLGFSSQPLLKAGNWMGPLLVAAAQSGVRQLLVFGYHGKLVKLAGGIFHTHHHLADGRIEVLTSLAVQEGLPLDLIQTIATADSVEAAFLMVQKIDQGLARNLWMRVARTVEKQSSAYLERYGSWPIEIGAVMFDRQRQLQWAGPNGLKSLNCFGVTLST